MRKPIRIAAGILALAALCAAALLAFVDVNQYRDLIQAKLRDGLHRKVALGAMSLKLYPLAIRAADVRIDDDPAFAEGAFLTAKSVDVRVGLLPLLRKEIRVDSLHVVLPAIELIRKGGKWNFSTLGGGASSGESGGAGGLELEDLRLTDGSVAVTTDTREVYDDIDLTLKNFAPGKQFDGEVTMRFPGKVQAVAFLKGKYDKSAQLLEASSLGIKIGSLHIAGEGTVNLASAPAVLDLRMRSDKAAISELTKLAAAAGKAFHSDMKVEGVLNSDLHITGPANAVQLDGSITASKVEVSKKGWKQPVRTPEIRLQLKPETLEAAPFQVESGATRLTASARVKDYAGTPSMVASLSTRDASLEELLNAAAAFGISAAQDVQGSGVISLDVRLSGPASDLTYSGSGHLRDATLKLAALSKPLTVKNTNIRFEEDSAVLDNLSCQMAGSNVKGNIKIRGFASPRVEFRADIDTLDVAALQGLVVETPASAPAPAPVKKRRARKSEPPAVERMKASGALNVGRLQSGSFVLSNVRSEVSMDKGVLRMEPLSSGLFGGSQRGSVSVDLRSGVSSYSVQTKFEKVDANQLLSSTSSVKNFVYGLLMADADLRLAPKPGEDFARSLNGTMSLKMNEGKLTGVNIMNEMTKIAKFMGYTEQGQMVTNVLSLTGNIKITDGVASTNDLKLAIEGGSMGAAGTINLADQTLRLKLTTVFSKEMSERLGGSKVGGFMTTALANSKGEIVIPSQVSGSFAKPVFVPDAAEFARLKMQSILPSSGNPAGIVGGVMDAVKGGQQGGSKGVGDALWNIFGGRKQEQKKDAAKQQ